MFEYQRFKNQRCNRNEATLEFTLGFPQVLLRVSHSLFCRQSLFARVLSEVGNLGQRLKFSCETIMLS